MRAHRAGKSGNHGQSELTERLPEQAQAGAQERTGAVTQTNLTAPGDEPDVGRVCKEFSISAQWVPQEGIELTRPVI